MRLIAWLAAVVSLSTLLFAEPAQAACSVAPAITGDLGAVTSYDLRAGPATPTAMPAMLRCTGTVLTVMSTDYARATATSANSLRLRSSGGASIGYRLSADSAGNVAFTQGSTINYLDSSLLSLLTVLSPTNFVPTMYAATVEKPNVPAGTYTDTVTIAWSWKICAGVGVGLGGASICVLEYSGTATSTITVTLVVTADCRILAPPVVFGSAPFARGFAPVSQAVAVDCTQGTSFKVAFSSGASGASRPWRAMSDGAGNRLRYNLYRADGATIWDETNPLPGTLAGTGGTSPTQLFPYVARIDPTSTPPAGSYSDVVSVIVTF